MLKKYTSNHNKYFNKNYHSCFCLKNGSIVRKNSLSNISSENRSTDALKK